MQTLTIIRYRLSRLYCFIFFYGDFLPYKHLICKAFVSGNRKLLYLLRFLFPLKRIISKLFLLLANSLHIFTFISRATNSFVPLRFWVLILHHFMVFYTIVVTIRFVFDFAPAVNLAESNVVGQIIFHLSEPYYRIAETVLPKGMLILTFMLLDYLERSIGLAYRILILYSKGSKQKLWIEALDILTLSLYGESVIPR